MIASCKTAGICIADCLSTHIDIRECFVVTDREIIKRSSADDWHYYVITDIKTDLHVCKFSHYTGSCFKTKCRTSAENNCVDRVNGIFASQEICFPCSRASASDIYTADCTLFADYDCTACTFFTVFCITNLKVCNIGNADHFHSHMISFCSVQKPILLTIP